MPKPKTLKAAATNDGFAAQTNKSTHLLRLGSESIPLPNGQALWIYREDGSHGLAFANVQGGVSGSVPKADYDRT